MFQFSGRRVWALITLVVVLVNLRCGAAQRLWSGKHRRRCPVIYHPMQCNLTNPKLPQCIGYPFKEEWLTLHQGALKEFISSPLYSRYNGNGTWRDAKLSLDEWRQVAPHEVTGSKQQAKEPAEEFASTDWSSPMPTCALVSSSASILGTGSGADIDAHDVVMRMNDARTAGYERDVGAKTTARYTNPPNEGFREQNETVVTKWCAPPQGPPCRPADLLRTARKKAHPLNPLFVNEYAKTLPGFRENGHLPTAGFMAVLFLLHVCAEVHIYGFGASRAISDTEDWHRVGKKMLKNWYYDKHKANDVDEAHRLRNQSWDVDAWTYLSGDTEDGAGQRGARSSPRRVLQGEAGMDGADHRRVLQEEAGIEGAKRRGGSEGPGSTDVASRENPVGNPRRRLLVGSQSDTLVYEKRCLHALHHAEIIQSDDFRPVQHPSSVKAKLRGKKKSSKGL